MVAFERQPAPAAAMPPGIDVGALPGLSPEGRAARPTVDARRAPRVRAASPLWLCGDAGSVRGWALELSSTGARVGGAGVALVPGARVVVKIAMPAGEASIALRAEVVRHAAVQREGGVGCPEVCLRFLEDAEAGVVQALERARLEALLATRVFASAA